MGMSILNALRGIGGEFEVQRVLGAFGTVTYTVAAPIFVAVGKFGSVSVTEFCLAFPSGLAACIAASAGAIALKDRQVATAKATEATTRAANVVTDGREAANAGPPPKSITEAAEQVADAAADEKDKIAGKGNV